MGSAWNWKNWNQKMHKVIIPKFICGVSVWKITKRTQHLYMFFLLSGIWHNPHKKYTIHNRKGSDGTSWLQHQHRDVYMHTSYAAGRVVSGKLTQTHPAAAFLCCFVDTKQKWLFIYGWSFSSRPGKIPVVFSITVYIAENQNNTMSFLNRKDIKWQVARAGTLLVQLVESLWRWILKRMLFLVRDAKDGSHRVSDSTEHRKTELHVE